MVAPRFAVGLVAFQARCELSDLHSAACGIPNRRPPRQSPVPARGVQRPDLTGGWKERLPGKGLRIRNSSYQDYPISHDDGLRPSHSMQEARVQQEQARLLLRCITGIVGGAAGEYRSN